MYITSYFIYITPEAINLIQVRKHTHFPFFRFFTTVGHMLIRW